MKKFAKLAAVLAVLVLALSCFVACSSGDDDSSGSASESTWVSTEGYTLTFDGNGKCTFAIKGKTYTGTYSETVSVAEASTGTIGGGGVEGYYTIAKSGAAMSVFITQPSQFAREYSFTKK